MPATSRPTRLPLGNNFLVTFEDPRVEGEVDPGLTLRAMVANSRGAASPIHPDLEAAATWNAGLQRYQALFPGSVLTDRLAGRLHERVWIVGESVPPGSYREAYPVTVSEDQGE